MGRNTLDHSTVRLEIMGFTLMGMRKIVRFCKYKIPAHNGASKRFVWRLCIRWIKEGSNLDFGEWLKIIGGVVENALRGTATMSIGMVME